MQALNLQAAVGDAETRPREPVMGGPAAPAWLPPPPPPGWQPPPPAPKAHTGRNLAIGLVVVVVVLIVVLAVAATPLPHPFSAQLDTGAFNAPTWQLDPPAGSTVSGAFSTESGGSVTFGIVDGGGSPIYSADSASGSFSFTAAEPPYTFSAYSIIPQYVKITGSYDAPYG